MSLQCPKCNTTNVDEAKFCKNCGVLIEKKVSYNATKNVAKPSYTGWIVALLAFGILLVFSNKQVEQPVEANATEAPTVTSTEEFQSKTDSWYATHTPLLVPETGIMERKSKKGNAPLEIHTSSSTGNYFIKIDNLKTGKTALKAFIRSGEIFSTTLPTGEYELKYANGDSWYGEADLFGPETSYSKAGETFFFDGYNGYTVELIQQVGGNLQTQTIDAQNF